MSTVIKVDFQKKEKKTLEKTQNAFPKQGDSLRERPCYPLDEGTIWNIVVVFKVPKICGYGKMLILRKSEWSSLMDILTIRFISQRKLSEKLHDGRYKKLMPIVKGLSRRVGMHGR